MTNPARTTPIVSPSLWPTIDGEAGHQLLFQNASLQVSRSTRSLAAVAARTAVLLATCCVVEGMWEGGQQCG